MVSWWQSRVQRCHQNLAVDSNCGGSRQLMLRDSLGKYDIAQSHGSSQKLEKESVSVSFYLLLLPAVTILQPWASWTYHEWSRLQYRYKSLILSSFGEVVRNVPSHDRLRKPSFKWKTLRFQLFSTQIVWARFFRERLLKPTLLNYSIRKIRFNQ